MIILFVTLLLVSLLPRPRLSSTPNNFTESIGDQNYSYTPLPLYSFLVIIKLIQPGNATLNIYISSSEPAKAFQHLPEKNTGKYNGPRRYNYNYYGGDQPIYLLPNSSITYIINKLNNNSSPCPTQFFLFDNFTSYYNFKNHRNYTPVASSPCLMGNVTKSPTNLTWIFNITKQGSYYVGLAIDTGIAVTSNVSVIRVHYNITGLVLENPSECSQPLSVDHLSCQITLQCSKFYCDRRKQFLVVKSIGEVEVSYSFLTMGLPIFNMRSKSILFIFNIILTSIIGCFILIIIIACCINKKCQNGSKSKSILSFHNLLHN